MAKALKVWYDREGDFLEILFTDEAGYMRETSNESIMERVNSRDEIIGFSILGVSQNSTNKPLYYAELAD